MLHTEEARLVSVLTMLFGGLLAFIGALMIFELSSDADVSGSVGLTWGGLAMVFAGKAIRKNRVFVKNPRWFLAAFLFGISSSAGLYKTISTNDIAAIVGLIPLQVFALYALWRSCWR